MVVQNHNAILKQSKGIQQLEVGLHSFAKSHQDRRHRQQSLIPTHSWCNPYAIPRNGRTRPPESIEQAGVQGGFVLPLRGDCESQIRKDNRARNRIAKRRQSTTIRNASQLHEPTHISAKGHRIPAILIIHMQSAIMLRSQRDCSTDVQEHTELATAGLHRKRPRTSQRNLQHVFGNP